MPHVQHTCPTCGAALTAPLDRRRGHCTAPACQRAAAQAVGRRRAEMEQAAVRARGRAAARAAGLAHGFGVPALAPEPVERDPADVAALFASIDAAIDAAFADPDMPLDPFEDEPPHDPVTAAVYGACQGGCCSYGYGRHAFVTAPVIARQRAREPHLTADDLRVLYRAARPNRSGATVCLYQGPEGCGLPRARRSNVCNGYVCGQVHAARALAAERPDEPFAVGGFRDGAPPRITVVKSR